MKKFSLAIATILAFLSIAGCAQHYGQDYGPDYYGKGKAPPSVVTKG